MKKYDIYKDSGIEWIGEIPGHWKIGKAKQGFSRKKEKAFKENPTVLSLTSKGVIIRDISNNDGQIAESYFEYNPVVPGDLLLNPMDLVSNAFSFVSNYEGVISPAYFNLKNKINFYSNYYKYYFQLQYWNSSFFHHGKGVSTEHRWTLNEEAFKCFPIPIPSFEEQKLIADYLDEEIEKINFSTSQKEKLISLFEEEKQATINQSVTKGINPNVELKYSEIDWIGDIPAHWNIKRLRYLGNCQNGISQGADYFGSGYPFVNYGDIYKNIALPETVTGLANSTESDRDIYSVKKGDVFFTRTSETIEEIGFASTCLKTIEDAVFSGFVIRFRPTNDRLVDEFAKYYFRAQVHRKFFVKEMNLVTRASLSQELLKKLPVLLPPKEEQIEIANYLDQYISNINLKIDKTKRIIELLKEYKTALISEVVTGKVKVTE
jgi:type I restriction enzyme S subunit